MSGPNSESRGALETGSLRLRMLVPLLGLCLGLTGAAVPSVPSVRSGGELRLTDMAPAPADPEFVEWADSHDARRSEFSWSLEPGAGYAAVRDALVASLAIEGTPKPRYRSVEFLDHNGVLAEQSRFLRVRRTFSDGSFAKLRSADVTLKVRGEDEAGVRSQLESLWRTAGRKKRHGGRVPWCLAKGRSCKLEWDRSSGGSPQLAFSMKREADDEEEVRARLARVAAMAGAPEPKPICQEPAQELSWSAKIGTEGELPRDVVIDFAWWHQADGHTHAMEVSVQTDDAEVVDFVTRRISHLLANRPASKTLSYLAACRP